MITLASNKNAYGLLKNTTLVLEKRHVVFNIDEIANKSMADVRSTYRELFVPVVMWDEEIQSIDLFESIAKSSIAVPLTDTVSSVLRHLKLDVIEYYSQIEGIGSGYSRWVVDPHEYFKLHAVEPGKHPDHYTPDELRVDLLLEERYLYHNEHNLVWCLGNHFVYSRYRSGNYYIPNGRVILNKQPNKLMVSYLDLSELDCSRPVRFKENYSVDDGNLMISLPEGNWDGVLLFVAGRLILDIKDTHDIVITANNLKIPMVKIETGITHLGSWLETYQIEELTDSAILEHETSFFIPYKNDLYAEYSLLKTDHCSDNHITSVETKYTGSLLIDSDGEIIPFLTEKLPSEDGDDFILETHYPRRKNYFTTTDYLNKDGIRLPLSEAINELGTGVYYRPKSDNIRSVRLASSSFNSIIWED